MNKCNASLLGASNCPYKKGSLYAKRSIINHNHSTCTRFGEVMPKDNATAENALTAVIQVLSPLEDDARARVISSLITFYNFSGAPARRDVGAGDQVLSRPPFSEDHKPSPKEFLHQKQPKTDVERMACLAYYLTHFRDLPHFKTIDLAKLNTEAAQIKFSNAAYAASNAIGAGFLAPAPKGERQITAAGEQFVVALPDRDAAKLAISLARRRKAARKR